MVREKRIELVALLEVLHSFKTANVLEEVKVVVSVDAGTYESVPVNTLQLDVGVVFLEAKVQSFAEVDVGSFDCVHVLTRHFKLVEIEVLSKYFQL